MARMLYDLAGEDDRRFSPYCWRTKLALSHKGLDFETRAVRFTEIDALAPGETRLTLPTLEVDGRRMTDSWAIAAALEADYPDAPSLFPTGAAHARFVQAWANTQIQPQLLRVILLDVYEKLGAADQAYFRESREKRFGATLEEVAAGGDAALDQMRRALQPARDVLAEQPFLAGAAPAYADYILAGSFLWPRHVGRDDVLADDDPVKDWLKRVAG
jgi:glutathione S-transferase